MSPKSKIDAVEEMLSAHQAYRSKMPPEIAMEIQGRKVVASPLGEILRSGPTTPRSNLSNTKLSGRKDMLRIGVSQGTDSKESAIEGFPVQSTLRSASIDNTGDTKRDHHIPILKLESSRHEAGTSMLKSRM